MMILILALVSVFSLQRWTDLPNYITNASFKLHHFCLQSLPKHVENLSSLETLVCGKNMQDPFALGLLTQTSLIHIFIVSGSHFLLLHKILACVVKDRLCALTLLIPYAMVTLCQPPSVRSLIFLFLIELSRRQKFFSSGLHTLTLSFLMCVSFFPQWIASRSFLMSLMAALAIALSSEWSSKETSSLQKAVLAQICTFTLMTFCLWGISSLHPLTILINLSLGTLIGTVIFPLGLLVVVFPGLSVLFDGLLKFLWWCLQKTQEVLPVGSQARPLNIDLQWGLWALFLIFGFAWQLQQRRRRYEI